VESFTFLPYQVWMEQELRGSETRRADLQGEKLAQRRRECGVALFTAYSLDLS